MKPKLITSLATRKSSLQVAISFGFAIFTLSLFSSVSVLAQPANDSFSSRALIAPNSVLVWGTLSNATSETGEPLLDGISSGQTAWWSWIAPSNGLLTISTAATNFNPLLTVYSGDQLANLSLIASNNYLICYSDGDCGCHWRMRDSASFHVFRGQSYQICVDSPILTDASMEWTTNPAIVESVGGFQTVTAFDPNGTPQPPPPVYGVVFTTNVAPGDNVQLALNFIPAPPNDDFAKVATIQGSRFHVIVSNGGATKEPDEPNHAGNTGGSSVWYSWIAPASGRVTLSTNEIAPYAPPSWQGYFNYGDVITEYTYTYTLPDCGEAVDQNPPPVFYPLLAAYTGTAINSLASANSLSVGLDAYPYAIELDVIQGHKYHFACDGNMGTTNSFPLYVALTKPAVNDAFARRILVQGTYVAASGYNAGAVKQTGAPSIGNGSTGKLVWWSWIAPVDGTVSINLSGSDYTFPLAVFTGSKLASLNMVSSGAGSLSFTAKLGQTYQIAVGDASGLTGEIKLVLQAPVIEAPLVKVVSAPSTKTILLRYQASPGQVLQLQRSTPSNWQNVQKAIAHHKEADFAVKSASGTNGLAYRAIIVNYIPQ